jgi:hypothetical protein
VRGGVDIFVLAEFRAYFYEELRTIKAYTRNIENLQRIKDLVGAIIFSLIIIKHHII